MCVFIRRHMPHYPGWAGQAGHQFGKHKEQESTWLSYKWLWGSFQGLWAALLLSPTTPTPAMAALAAHPAAGSQVV